MNAPDNDTAHLLETLDAFTVRVDAQSAEVDELQDRRRIHEVVLRYCRGGGPPGLRPRPQRIPRGRSRPHHTGFDGSRGDYVSWLQDVLPALDGTTHFIGNHYTEFVSADRAISETYLIATHWGTPADSAARNFLTGARYVDHMERRAGVWAIAERWAAREWTMPVHGGFAAPEGPGPRGAVDATDPLTALRARLGAADAHG